MELGKIGGGAGKTFPKRHKMKKIFIIILNYNGFDDTAKCLQTLYLLKNKSYILKTVIVDNGSSQVQLNKLKKFLDDFTDIELIENGKNLGFAKGNNNGIRYALNHQADFILLLNNDTKIEMNFLKKLLFLAAPISSPVVKFREFRDKPKLIYDLGGYVNWTTGRTTHLNAYAGERKLFQDKEFIEVDYVAGCCMLVKEEVFQKIGLLDEKYFIYFEDVDFCVTAKRQGFRVIVDPKSIVYHKLGGSMDRWSKRAIFHNLFSNFIFITKHLEWRIFFGYAYLFFLTAKIVRDRIAENLLPYINRSFNTKGRRKWKGAPHNFHAK